MLDGSTLQANLEWEEKSEEELVILVQSSAGVVEDLKGQVVNDVLDPLAWDRRFLWPTWKSANIDVVHRCVYMTCRFPTVSDIVGVCMWGQRTLVSWSYTLSMYYYDFNNLKYRCAYEHIHLSMEMSKTPRNCRREVWYITFTMDISTMRKYRMDPRAATGRYSSRAVLIFTSVSAAITSFSFTSRAVSFVVRSTSIRDSSSTRDPW